MNIQHFLFGSDHLPFERRVLHFADVPGAKPEEIKSPVPSSIDVTSPEFKALQAKLAKEGYLIGSLADHHMEGARTVVASPHAPAPETHPYDGRCCPPAVKPVLEACKAEPLCPPGFVPDVSKVATEARVSGYCEGAARTHMVAVGRLPSAPARAPMAGDRRVWPRNDGSRGVGYQMFTMDKGWVWTSDYNPERSPNRWKGIKMKDPSPSMMRQYGPSSRAGDGYAGRSGGGYHVVDATDPSIKTTYASRNTDRPIERRPLSSYSAKERQTEKILRESETPLSRAREKVNQATNDYIKMMGALGRFDGSRIRMNETFRKDFANMWNSLHDSPLGELFELSKSQIEILSKNHRFSIQVFSDLGDDMVHSRVYGVYDKAKGDSATKIFSSAREALNALNAYVPEDFTAEWERPADAKAKAADTKPAPADGFRPRSADRTPKTEAPPGEKSVLRREPSVTEKHKEDIKFIDTIVDQLKKAGLNAGSVIEFSKGGFLPSIYVESTKFHIKLEPKNGEYFLDEIVKEVDGKKTKIPLKEEKSKETPASLARIVQALLRPGKSPEEALKDLEK